MERQDACGFLRVVNLLLEPRSDRSVEPSAKLERQASRPRRVSASGGSVRIRRAPARRVDATFTHVVPSGACSVIVGFEPRQHARMKCQPEHRRTPDQRPVLGRECVDPRHRRGLGRIRQAVNPTGLDGRGSRSRRNWGLPPDRRATTSSTCSGSGCWAVANFAKRSALSGARGSSSIRITVGTLGASNPESDGRRATPNSQGRAPHRAGYE